jgi:hypothetical protein
MKGTEGEMRGRKMREKRGGGEIKM